MFCYDPNTKTITSTAGGCSNEGLQIRDTYVYIGSCMHGMRCVLYEPVLPVEKSRIGVVIAHSDDDYSVFPIGGELAKRGYRALCGQVRDTRSTLDARLLDIKQAVEFLRAYPGIEKVVLMGHSGGATLMSAYQAAAENSVGLFKAGHILIKCGLTEELPPADGLVTLDSNWGNGAMTLFSIDPAVVEEDNGVKIDPELDVFNPANGYAPEGSCYSDAFLKKFCEAQADRNNKIIRRALERLHALETGKGRYTDDEPFVVAGAAQFGPCNKLFPEDLHLFSHTKDAYPLLHHNGPATHEVIRSVRMARGGQSVTQTAWACVIDTVRSYLTNRAVMAGPDYAIKADCAEGIQWENTYNCTLNNIKFIHNPLFVMGMTGSYEYLASETLYQNAGSQDKTISFVEGAGHNFDPISPQYGDTAKIVFDSMDQWLSAAGRF